MGNPPAHKAEVGRGALDRAGLGRRYLPPYSPDLNPIEPAWSKLEARLRAEAARSREALEAALGPALATIAAQDARGWFRLAGYAPANCTATRSRACPQLSQMTAAARWIAAGKLRARLS